MSLNAADIVQTPMSTTLAASLSRATEAAGTTGAGEVSLEHVLAALCDDTDAVAVLDASHISIERLKSDAIGYLVRQPPTPQGPAGLVVSQDVRRILEAAAAAARGGRRRDINGAIVLAAIVGDGRSVAAQMLQAQGLTFDSAIRALQAALAQPVREYTAEGPAPADDVLARARERVQSRQAPSLRQIMGEMPGRALPPPAPLPAQPMLSPPVHDSWSPDVPAVAPPLEPAPPAPEPPIWQPKPRPSPEPVSAPQPAPAAELPPASEAVEVSGNVLTETTPAAAEPALSAITPDAGSGEQSLSAPAVAPPSVSATLPPPDAIVPSTPAPGAMFEPVTAAPAMPTMAAPPTHAQALAPPASAPAPPPGFAPSAEPLPGAPLRLDRPPPTQLPPPIPTAPPQPGGFMPAGPGPGSMPGHGPVHGPGPGLGAGPGFAPFAAGAPAANFPPQRMEPNFGSAGPRPGFAGPQPPAGPGGFMPMPAAMPPPGMAPRGPGMPGAPLSAGPRPGAPFEMPGGQRPMPPHGPAPSPPQPRANTGPAASDATDLIEIECPATMRLGVSERVDISVSKARVRALMDTRNGGGAAWRHDVTVAQAMAVRLRAPDGGLLIETASPETVWLEAQPGFGEDDMVQWRFVVTPQQRGRLSLQASVSARTIGADGTAAETALPDSIVDVKVRRNGQRTLARLFGWIVLLAIGAALARYGAAGLDFAQGLLKKLAT